ncbi:MAG: flagellar biosynthetic protein FliP, partial [Pseudomonadota bacterium]
MKTGLYVVSWLALLLLPSFAFAQQEPLPLVIPDAGVESPQQLSLSLQILILMTLLTLLPALLLSMSAF